MEGYVVSVVTSRKDWAMLFYNWAKDEVIPFSDEDKDMIQVAQKTYNKTI